MVNEILRLDGCRTVVAHQQAAADGAVTARLPETYQWLLVPIQTTPQSAVTWQTLRLSGQDALAVRASRKLKHDELLVTSFAASRLRMELDRVPLWRRDDHDQVAIQQLMDDFASYLYLPRLKDSSVLLGAIRSGLNPMTWEQDSFAYAENWDESAHRYRGLCSGRSISIGDGDAGLLVKPENARRQIDAETAPPKPEGGAAETLVPPGPRPPGTGPGPRPMPLVRSEPQPVETPKPRRYHGTVTLDPGRTGRDASRIADEVIAHLVGLVGADVIVTLEIEAEIPAGVPDHVVRTVTENSRTLKFTSHGFETE